MRWAIASLTAAALLAACGPETGLDALAAGGRGQVTAVPSGDVLVLQDGAQVRLAGVEAPHGGDPYAAEATAALSALAMGREVELLQGGAPKDPYGRTLAHAREARTRLWLEGELLRAGAVRVRTYDDNRALAGAMLEAEARARVAKRGLWGLAAYEVRLPQEVRAGDRGLMVVEGRVRAVSREGGRLRLSFAEAPEGFTAEIPRSAWDDFRAAGLEPGSLGGRLVRVRGGVRASYGRPTLWLDHPEQVERLVEPRR